MPYSRRTYKRKYPYRRRAYTARRRKAAYIAKKRRQYRFALRRNMGRQMPFYKLYRNAGQGTNQSMQVILKNETEYDVYVSPDSFQNPKVDQVTNAIFFETITTPFDRNLQQCFENIGTTPVMLDFRTLLARFNWVRFKWIEVTLIPENYIGVSSDDSKVGEPKHPILHTISDNGTSAIGLGQLASYSLDTAQTLGRGAYQQKYFNKPVKFKINPVERTNPGGSLKLQNQWSTYSSWVPTTSAIPQNTDGTWGIPNNNFYYGFSDVPTDFQFKVQLRCCCVVKQITLD